MTQYIALIHNNAKSETTPEEWRAFVAKANRSRCFKGGSEIGVREVIGDRRSVESTDHIVGYMQFDTKDKQQLVDLLASHPVVVHGGSLELCELPKS